LTPARPLQLVALKTGIAMTVAAVPVALIYAIGAATGARGDLGDWLWTAMIIWGGSAMFAIYGLAVCTNFRSQNAVSVASGMIVVLAFLGNVFSPMSGLILDIGRLTPLYGYAGLARYPLTDGHLPLEAGHDPVWLLVANVAAWTVIFALLALLGVRRSRERV
jgi:ABC-2 type transport system permease protein